MQGHKRQRWAWCKQLNRFQCPAHGSFYTGHCLWLWGTLSMCGGQPLPSKCAPVPYHETADFCQAPSQDHIYCKFFSWVLYFWGQQNKSYSIYNIKFNIKGGCNYNIVIKNIDFSILNPASTVYYLSNFSKRWVHCRMRWFHVHLQSEVKVENIHKALRKMSGKYYKFSMHLPYYSEL